MLLLAALGLAAYLLFLPKPVNAEMNKGPRYDLIFGVRTFNPNVQSTVTMGPYVIDGTLYVEAEKMPVDAGTTSTGLMLYRYNSQTGHAEPLPLPKAGELAALTGKQQFVVAATKNIQLNTDAESPDGYALAAPEWVPVGPISNVLGNIVLLLLSGKTETIKERENMPRLAKGSLSIAMKSKRPIFQNEADNAFLLGWVVPADR